MTPRTLEDFTQVARKFTALPVDDRFIWTPWFVIPAGITHAVTRLYRLAWSKGVTQRGEIGKVDCTLEAYDLERNSGEIQRANLATARCESAAMSLEAWCAANGVPL